MMTARPTPVPPGVLVLRFIGGPWHGFEWRPANPAGVQEQLRLTGWDGVYLRSQRDYLGHQMYAWSPDIDAPPPKEAPGAYS